MLQKIEDIEWRYGVWIRQRVPMSEQNLPENLRIRPFTTQIVAHIDADDFPIERMRDRSEFVDWIEQNIGHLGDGFFYLHGFGRCNVRRWSKRSPKGKFSVRKKAGMIFVPKLRKYKGFIGIAKFELTAGKVSQLILKRSREKLSPTRDMYPNYPLMNWLKA